VRHGHLPEREIVTGIGPVAVRCPRVRDRVGKGSERIRFSSAILPPYARRSKSLEVLIPILYLKGVSTGDFEEAVVALLDKDAGGLSASTIGRLKDGWSDEHARWSRRDLSPKRYVYCWVDGIHVQARLEDDPQCLQVNLLAHAPQRLHEEITADYNDMIYAATREEIEARRKTFIRKWRSSIAPSPTACRKPATAVQLHAAAAEPGAQRSHHQCHRAAARRVQTPDQNPDHSAIGRHRSHVVLGAVCFWPNQHAQRLRLADACHQAHRSAN
jgi:transposase-like protein